MSVFDQDDECIHGLGPVSACVLCNGKAAKERSVAETVDYFFRASFAGPVACGHTVDRGDELARMLDGRIICEDCAP